MNKDAKIYIAGHNGMVGSAIWRTLTLKAIPTWLSFEQGTGSEKPTSSKDFMAEKNQKLLTLPQKWRDLGQQWFSVPVMENMQIQNNLIDTALQSGGEVYFLGSSCIYPN
jgi:GDP-L-fucose synthase